MTLSASEIDVHVGLRMRHRREHMGISQGRLGRHLGLTFSQIQKYEKGTNRIGAGRLYQIAAFLGVQPSFFFEGVNGGEVAGAALRSSTGSRAPADEMAQLAEAFASIPSSATRAAALALMRSLGSPSAARNTVCR